MRAKPAQLLGSRSLPGWVFPRGFVLCLVAFWPISALHSQESLPGSIPVSFTVQLAEGKRFISTGGTLTLSMATNADASPSSVSYQWRRDGQPIPGATTRTLTLDNLQPRDSGLYDLVAAGIAFPYVGSVTSNAVTIVVGQLSQIVRQSPGIDTVAGSTAVFRVEATGDGPLTYQWRFNGANIQTATNGTLTLSNVWGYNAGAYSVVVSNALGAVTSRVA